MDETREHYVLNGLYLHIMMLLDNAMMAPAAVTMPAPVVAMPAPVVAPAPVAAPTPVTSAPVAASTVSSGQAYSQELANLIANSYKK